MREEQMSRFVINKIDQFINCLTISFIACGGMAIHILTALTIKSYYGSIWGYISFLTPGFSEIYLLALQISDSMYNYMILLALFTCITAALVAACLIKNTVKARIIEDSQN